MSCEVLRACPPLEVFVGALGPERIVLRVDRGDLDVDLTTAIEADSSILVMRGDTSTSVWSVVFENQTTTSVDLCHAYEAGDVAEPDSLVLVARVALPGGVRRAFAGLDVKALSCGPCL
jgi:hypothetical protein